MRVLVPDNILKTAFRLTYHYKTGFRLFFSKTPIPFPFSRIGLNGNTWKARKERKVRKQGIRQWTMNNLTTKSFISKTLSLKGRFILGYEKY